MCSPSTPERSGSTHEDIIKEFPDLTNEKIAACPDYVRDLSEFEVAVRWH